MSGYPLQRLGLVMELEPGNPQEIESVLNPAAARALTANFTCFRGSSRGAIIRALALPGCGLVRLATRPESSGLALRSSLATFLPYDGIEFDGVDNKDCVFQRKRTPVPIQSGHAFQLISDSCRSEATLWV